MANGMDRFDVQLKKLENLLTTSSQQKDPAVWLYENDVRTPLFKLEGLTRIYKEQHNKPMFEKLTQRFKQLEDILGSIGHYDEFVKEFSKKEEIPGLVVGYLERKKQESLLAFNDMLRKGKWLGEKVTRVEKIRKKLQKADWNKEKQEINAIASFLQNEIAEINDFYKSIGGTFTDLENHVHELRRKLRWLSIYPQALMGCVQLTDSKPDDKNVQKYLVPETIDSPFNKLPDAGDNSYFLLLEKNYFLSLSWVIAELGKLKDPGLGLMALNEAVEFHKSNLQGNMESIQKAAASGETLDTILEKASAVSKAYLEEKNLEKLMAGIKKIKE